MSGKAQQKLKVNLKEHHKSRKTRKNVKEQHKSKKIRVNAKKRNRFETLTSLSFKNTTREMPNVKSTEFGCDNDMSACHVEIQKLNESSLSNSSEENREVFSYSEYKAHLEKSLGQPLLHGENSEEIIADPNKAIVNKVVVVLSPPSNWINFDANGDLVCCENLFVRLKSIVQSRSCKQVCIHVEGPNGSSISISQKGKLNCLIDPVSKTFCITNLDESFPNFKERGSLHIRKSTAHLREIPPQKHCPGTFLKHLQPVIVLEKICAQNDSKTLERNQAYTGRQRPNLKETIHSVQKSQRSRLTLSNSKSKHKTFTSRRKNVEIRVMEALSSVSSVPFNSSKEVKSVQVTQQSGASNFEILRTFTEQFPAIISQQTSCTDPVFPEDESLLTLSPNCREVPIIDGSGVSLSQWKNTDVWHWLETNGFHKLIPQFTEVDGESMMELLAVFAECQHVVVSYLKDMGCNLQESLRMCKLLRALSAKCS